MATGEIRSSTNVEADISRLEEWLHKQPHLPKDIDRELLVAFAHGTNSLEIAKKKLDSYLSASGKCPQLFGFPARDPLDEDFKEASRSIKEFFLPKMTKEGNLAVMLIIGDDFSKYHHDQYMTRLMMMLDLAMMKWPNVTGIVGLFDLERVDKSFLKKLTFESTLSFVRWVQSTMPKKMKLAVWVNTPKFFVTSINSSIKPFMTKKLYDRIILTSEGRSAFKKYVDEEMLPSDYGGKAASCDDLNNYWMQELIKNRDWFLKTSQLRVDESKRPPDEQDSFGIQGTFRSLALD